MLIVQYFSLPTSLIKASTDDIKNSIAWDDDLVRAFIDKHNNVRVSAGRS
jgi:hypothetical protein